LTAAELTAQNLDKSALLDDLLRHFDADDHELLAEFQLAFVMFLYGQSLEGDHVILAPCLYLQLAVVQCIGLAQRPESCVSTCMETGFAQWKTILQLALACERAALQTHTSFFKSLLAVLRVQLEYGISGKVPAVHSVPSTTSATFSPISDSLSVDRS
jgi:AAR2 protein